METLPVTFEYKGKEYKGTLDLISGSGSTSKWHLMVDRYYWGMLFHTTEWRFYSNSNPDMSEMAEYFGHIITAWLDSPEGSE